MLWPDTYVDFDQSLHFCVRQVRAAFGDSATEPTYVETLPRRGYRLMRPVELVAEEPSAAAILESDSRPAKSLCLKAPGVRSGSRLRQHSSMWSDSDTGEAKQEVPPKFLNARRRY